MLTEQWVAAGLPRRPGQHVGVARIVQMIVAGTDLMCGCNLAAVASRNIRFFYSEEKS